MGEELKLTSGTLYINGNEFKGISDFECTDEKFDESFEKSTRVMSMDKSALTFTCKFNWWSFMKLCGMWDWVIKYCPNKRVVHLAKYGRTTRVRHKNFRRACRLLEKEILR